MRKFFMAVYGTVAYVVFLLSFVYAIGFVGNLFFDKTIDSGQTVDLWVSFAINGLLLGVFAVQHSLMARPRFKTWFTKLVPVVIERSTYVLLSSLALLLLYWQWRPIPDLVWNLENSFLYYLILAIYFLGWAIVLLSSFIINHFELFGLEQVYFYIRDIPAREPKFKSNFFYGLVRHPIMLGFIIAFWATPTMSVGHLFFSIMTTVYIYIAVKYLEEKDLRKTLGEKYEEYQTKVPMLFPSIKKSSSITK